VVEGATTAAELIIKGGYNMIASINTISIPNWKMRLRGYKWLFSCFVADLRDGFLTDKKTCREYELFI